MNARRPKSPKQPRGRAEQLIVAVRHLQKRTKTKGGKRGVVKFEARLFRKNKKTFGRRLNKKNKNAPLCR